MELTSGSLNCHENLPLQTSLVTSIRCKGGYRENRMVLGFTFGNMYGYTLLGILDTDPKEINERDSTGQRKLESTLIKRV